MNMTEEKLRAYMDRMNARTRVWYADLKANRPEKYAARLERLRLAREAANGSTR